MRHREIGSVLLKGSGLEIGALHQPLKVPKNCAVDYLDIAEQKTLGDSFFDIDEKGIVKPKYVGDIGKASVQEITGLQFDFIIANHVLEHVPNPIQAIANMWNSIKQDGFLVVSVPDKEFMYDKTRPLTTFEHLLADYYLGTSEECNDHYIEFLEHVHPEAFKDTEIFKKYFTSANRRKEHLHVWNSSTFKEHLLKIIKLLQIEATIVFESIGPNNMAEYFAVIMKSESTNTLKVGLEILMAIYNSRQDLQKSFPGPDMVTLLQWAINACDDSDRYIILPYRNVLRGYLDVVAPESAPRCR